MSLSACIFSTAYLFNTMRKWSESPYETPVITVHFHYLLTTNNDGSSFSQSEGVLCYFCDHNNLFGLDLDFVSSALIVFDHHGFGLGIDCSGHVKIIAKHHTPVCRAQVH